jgi:hypothetical protein
MSWTPVLHTIFDLVPTGGSSWYEEHMYYGPYNTLLSQVLFPLSGNFVVSLEPQDEEDSPNSPWRFIVRHMRNRTLHPVLVLTVKPRGAIADDYRREEAHEQIHAAMESVGDIAIPTLYGVSALGSRICVYRYNARSSEICHPPIPGLPNTLTVVPPKEWWDMDIMSPEGEQRLQEILEHIKEMCAQL